MKKMTLLTTLLSLTAIGGADSVFAHDVSGSLGTASSAVDYYQVHCFDAGDGAGNTDHLEVAIRNNSTTTPKLSVQVIRDDTPGKPWPATARSSTDAVNGNATYSPAIKHKGGDGYFYITVDKTAAGAVQYSLQYHCEASDQQHTGTDIALLANQ